MIWANVFNGFYKLLSVVTSVCLLQDPSLGVDLPLTAFWQAFTSFITSSLATLVYFPLFRFATLLRSILLFQQTQRKRFPPTLPNKGDKGSSQKRGRTLSLQSFPTASMSAGEERLLSGPRDSCPSRSSSSMAQVFARLPTINVEGTVHSFSGKRRQGEQAGEHAVMPLCSFQLHSRLHCRPFCVCQGHLKGSL